MSDLWALRPYAVHVVIATETNSVEVEALSRSIATHVEQRAASVVGPVWSLTTSAAERVDLVAIRRAISQRDIQQLPPARAAEETPAAGNPSTSADNADPDNADPANQPTSGNSAEQAPGVAFEPRLAVGFDKLMLVVVDETPFGFAVSVVEYDSYVRMLGPTQEREAAVAAEVPEAVFQTVCQAFSPIAMFSIDRKDYKQAEMRMRGAELPKPASSPQWFRVDDIFQPIIRQADREGNVPPSGIRAAPWTLLRVTDNGAAPSATVVSHTRRPFGARRRGRVEQLAIRLPITGPATRLRLHAREDKNRPLPGYHVFARDTPEAELLPLGATDERGIVRIPRTESPLRTLFVKSGSKLVAKLPIAPGTSDQLEAPLVDESKRIEAEARLSLLREELIDLVARRTILIARTRAAVESEDFEEARALVAQLEGLDGLNVFNQRITDQEKQSRAKDPAVQARIDALFEQTRQVLGAFLSSGEIRALRGEVDKAAQKANG